MKKVIFGLCLGLAMVVVIFKLIERNHAQLLEIVKNLPSPIKLDSENSIKKYFAKKDQDNDNFAA